MRAFALMETTHLDIVYFRIMFQYVDSTSDVGCCRCLALFTLSVSQRLQAVVGTRCASGVKANPITQPKAFSSKTRNPLPPIPPSRLTVYRPNISHTVSKPYSVRNDSTRDTSPPVDQYSRRGRAARAMCLHAANINSNDADVVTSPTARLSRYPLDVSY